jgi:hypothetical protein
VIAVSNANKGTEPENLRLLGSYEVSSSDGTRVVKFDKTISIGR